MGIPYSYNKAIRLTKNNLVAICDSMMCHISTDLSIK